MKPPSPLMHRKRRMPATSSRRAGGVAYVAAALAFVLAAAPASALPAPVLQGFASITAGSFDSPPTFLDGGVGKLLDGALPSDASSGSFAVEGRLAIDWEPAVGWRLFLHGVARMDPESRESSSGTGLLEAFGERLFGFGHGNEIALRLGQFFLPSSRENVDPLWSSPYTLTLSAVNSWIAEELRPIGLDARWSRTGESGHRFTLGGTVFGGNDTSGTLLAWRGFALHARPTPTGRTIPLPADTGIANNFPLQQWRGTTPFGEDLDGKPGYAGRVRWDAPAGADGPRAVLQATIFLNEGDRRLHGDEYAWRTDFRWLSGEVALPAGLRLIGEWATGYSEMGEARVPGRSRSAVDIRFDAAYLLLTWSNGPLRLSIRRDEFEVDDLDETPGDDNTESGSAWTLAAMLRFGEHWRVGAEYVDLEAVRPGAAPVVPGGRLDARSALLELRVRF